MKNKKQKWTDDESRIIVLHYNKWGLSNPDVLISYFPHRSKASILLELDKYQRFVTQGCFELCVRKKYLDHRPKTLKKYRKIIEELL